MTFQEGWLDRQVALANEEIESWPAAKKDVMIKDEQPQVMNFQQVEHHEIKEQG